MRKNKKTASGINSRDVFFHLKKNEKELHTNERETKKETKQEKEEIKVKKQEKEETKVKEEKEEWNKLERDVFFHVKITIRNYTQRKGKQKKKKKQDKEEKVR